MTDNLSVDIVIPLNKGSIWKDNELRFCLRSIQKHCKDYRNIVIIGEKPDWLQNIVHIPYVETAKHELNIWHKVREACQSELITDNFLFANDDFFFLKPFSTDYPAYYGGTLSDYILRNRQANYFLIVEKTYQLLLSHGLPTLHYDIHRPMVFNKAKWLEMWDCFHPAGELIMKSCYGNFHKLTGIETTDMKVGARYAEHLEKHLNGAELFSIYDSLCGHHLFNYLTRRFMSKSKYEKF